MGIMYRLEADLRRDGTYALDEPDADLTPFVMAVDWREGMERSFDEVAAPAELRVTLANDGAFDPENAESAYSGRLHPGVLMRLQADDGETTHTLFIGRLKRVALTPAAYGLRQVVLLVQDFLLDLLDAEYAPPLLPNATIDEALRPMFELPLVAWPYASSFWMLDIPGSNVLGSRTTLYEDGVTAFETARTRLAYAGDNLDRGAGVSAQGAIRDLVAAEAGGRFFWRAQTGQFVFHNRAHDVLNETISAAFTSDDFMTEGTIYSYGDNLINALTVSYQGRDIGDAGSVLWAVGALPLLLRAGSGLTLDARYAAPDNPTATISAVDVIPPVPYQDMVATSSSSGGQDMTTWLTVSMRVSAGRARLRIVNTNVSSDLYVQLLQLRGTPLVAQLPLQASAQDPFSIALYERQEAPPLILRAVDDGEFAQQIAKFVVNRFSQPLARFARVAFMATDAMISQALTRRIGDKITITSTRLGHDADYVIVGQQHSLRAGGDQPHRVTWVLMPHSRTTYWRVSDGTAYAGYSRLDETARLML